MGSLWTKYVAFLADLLTSDVDPPIAKTFSEEMITAAKEGNINSTRRYLELGGDVNYIGCRGLSLQTALIAAVYHRKKEVVRLLIAHGADVNLRDHRGRTALQWMMLSSWSRCIKIFVMLCKSGANIHIKDDRGQDAIGALLSKQNIDIPMIMALIVAGAHLKVEVEVAMKFENAVVWFDAQSFFLEYGIQFHKQCAMRRQSYQPISLQRLAAHKIRTSLRPNAVVGIRQLRSILPVGVDMAAYITMARLVLKALQNEERLSSVTTVSVEAYIENLRNIMRE